MVRGGGAVRLGAIGVGTAGLLTAAAGRRMLPVRPLPVPTGPHAVGTRTAVVQGPRELPVQVWYPAQPTGRPGARLFPNPRVGAALAARYPVPAWVGAPLRLVRGNAVQDAPPADVEPRGVLVVVHGWTAFRAIHADLAEQLASEGWVVVAADHVGGSLAAQFPDGRVVPLEPSLMPRDGDPDYWPRARALVDRYAQDVTAVLDAVEAGALEEVPATDRVLVLGQSTGGGAAVRVAAHDRRVTGLVGLDPWVQPVRREDRDVLTQPMIAVRSGAWVGNRNDASLRRMRTVELRAVDEAGHSDLTALGYFGPLTRRVGLTRCDPDLAHTAALQAIADLAASTPTTPCVGASTVTPHVPTHPGVCRKVDRDATPADTGEG